MKDVSGEGERGVKKKKADIPSNLEDTKRRAKEPKEEVSTKHLKISGL